VSTTTIKNKLKFIKCMILNLLNTIYNILLSGTLINILSKSKQKLDKNKEYKYITTNNMLSTPTLIMMKTSLTALNDYLSVDDLN
jgi:hypothetical protein